MPWIRNKVAAAWRYSRTIFLNVASIATLMVGDVVGLMVGLDWNTVLSPRAAFYVIALVNIVNIYLRTQTTAAIGKKPVEGS